MAKANVVQKSMDMDDAYLELDRVGAVTSTLTHAYGGDANIEDTDQVRGVHGAIQYVAGALRGINSALSEQPRMVFAAMHVSEALGLADLLESVTDGKEIRFSDKWLCNYFSAMDGCISRALADIDCRAMEVSHAN